MMKAFLAVHGTQGAASASVRETVDGLTAGGGARAAALASGRRHLPHRGRAGPGRTRPDARRPPRDRPRLRAVPRAPLAGARQAGRAGRARPSPRCTCSTAASACRSTWRACRALIESACAGLGADVKPEPILAETMRNLYDGVPIDEVYKAVDPGRPHADREGPGLHPRHRAPAAAHDPSRRSSAEELLPAGRCTRATPTTSRSFIKKGVRERAARREAAAVRPDQAGRRAQGRPRPAVRLPRPADPVRPLLPARATRPASSCRRPSSCAWRWAWR